MTLRGLVLLGGLLLVLGGPSIAAGQGSDKVKVLLVDGQNNHAWQQTSPHLKRLLEECGRFTVDVATTPQRPKKDEDPAKYKEEMAKFRPDFAKYDVVVSNYNGDAWPAETRKALEAFVNGGKGLVIVHAANNAFGDWPEYNQMIGMGWRGTKGGDRLYLDDAGKEVKVPSGQGDGSGHRYTGPFAVTVRDREHPITKGMPPEWLHARDELYDNMRGPIANVHVLATAYSKGTKVHEPMIWTVSFGKGRIFHTPMGHDLNAMKCVGFIATMRRGTEWAATGAVTLALPSDFPTATDAKTVP
jgi:type 1 glutamine amidotransferase